MKDIKKFCDDDDTCVMIILVLTGFLLCMFFSNDDEGFMGAPINGGEDKVDSAGPGGAGPAAAGPGGAGPAAAPGAAPGAGLSESEGPIVGEKAPLGLVPPPPAPTNGYGSAQENINKLRQEPQFKASGGVQTGELRQVPSEFPMGVLDGMGQGYYPFQKLMAGDTVLSEWTQDRPIGKAPTPLEKPTPEAVQVQPATSDDTAPAPPGSGKSIKLVLFYAPWCGHSKNMLADYDAVIDEYNGKTKDGIPYEVIKIDMDENPEAAKEYGVEVRGFPTLYTFYTVGDRKISKIFNHRTKDQIIQELEKRGQQLK